MTFTFSFTPTWTFTSTWTPTPTYTPTMTFTPTNTATPTPYLELVKSVDRKTASVGDTVTYSLAYRNAGWSAASPVTLLDKLPDISKASYVAGSAEGGGVYNATSNTLTWLIPLLAPGDSATVHYAMVLPTFSNASSSDVDNQAVLSCSTGETPSSVSLKVSGSDFVQFAVYNEAGEQVMVLAKFWASGSVSEFALANDVIRVEGGHIDILYRGTVLASWNGSNGKGQLVANGSYYIKMDVVDSYGVDNSTIKTVTVLLPKREILVTVFNTAGEAVRIFNADQVRQALAGGGDIKTQDLQVGEVKLAPSVISPSYSAPSAADGSAVLSFPSGATMRWDGRNTKNEIVANGQYHMEINSQADGFAEQTVILPVDVLHGNLNPTDRTVLAPNPIQLSRDARGVFMIGRVGPSVDRTDVHLFTLAGAPVLTLVSDPGDPTRVVWSMSASGGRALAEGMYLAVVEQRSGEGVLNRTILKVLIVR
jgi:uncharacterized repeat protein (TIGR01451 family)